MTYVKAGQMEARAKELAEGCIGLTTKFKRKEGASGGTAYYEGPIVACEPLQPRVSLTGKSLVQLWKVTIKLKSGKLEEATLSKLPVPQAPLSPLRRPPTRRPNWSEIDDIVKLVKKATRSRRSIIKGRP